MQDIQSLIHQFLNCIKSKKINIAVIGDIIIDAYYNVEVSRISPEFPIQVMKSNTSLPSKIMPGGAGNVAFQTAYFNVDCTLFGCMDEDAAKELTGFNFKLIHENNQKRIPRKRRFYDGKYALMRWDVEDIIEEDFGEWQEARKNLVSRFEEQITKFDIVILSDYGKGFFRNNISQKIIEICNANNVLTIVDPKDKPLNRWRNCTIFKPNHQEEQLLANTITESSVCEPSDKLLQYLNCKAVITTWGPVGVFTKLDTHKLNENESYLDEGNIETQSVIGAGDCFAAVLATAIAHKFTYIEASAIAYEVAKIYVQDRFNQPVTPLQLIQTIDPINAKICRSPEDLTTYLNLIDGRRILSNGVFDIGHLGHISTLKFAKSLGDILIVAVDTDENVKRLKGKDRPINTLEDRMQLLASLEMVDFIIPFNGCLTELIKKLPSIDVLVKGGDYSADNVIGRDLVREVAIAPSIDNKSTTNIIKQIKNA